MKRPDANTVTAIAATVTALAALAVAVWDNVQSRSYNRLSVRPLLVLDALRSTTDSKDSGEFTISNQGVGPAVIRDVRIRYAPTDGTADTLRFGHWAELAARLRPLGYVVTGWTDLATDRPIGTDHSISLFRFEVARDADADSDQGSDMHDVQSVFDAVALDVVYESVYGERFSTDAGVD
ncbi:MAG: hypothetical protein PVF05_06130 [Gemmatimonadales bacterium]|jgi:hypothetical protein